MAWYRCGGGGLPAGLQSDMDTVLNKKFSTSTTYPPTDWPDTVNLMGPLPEKTASGAIAHITDGADGVPIKNWLVTLPASLDGYTEVNGYKGGKNFLPIAVDYPNYTQTKNDMTISVLANGKVKFNGTTTANTDFTFYSASIPSEPHLFVRNGTYTFSNIGSASIKMVVSGGNNNGFPYREIANGSYTGNITDETKPFNYIIFRISSGVTLLNVEIEPMLEAGSTATAYEAYTAPTQYTASLGRTIYGGTADIVTGEGEDENGNAFTFTPIQADTELGVNNFWADEGDSDVTYRADISLALAQNNGNRGLMMMRPTEPEETEETEETEGLEDELNR